MTACVTFSMTSCPVPHYLGRDINQQAAHRGGVAAQGQDVLQGILFEGLLQKEADDHQVIVGLIAGKPAKGEFFRTKVFQTAMRQFVGATLVMLKDQGGIVLPVFLVAARHRFQHRLSGREIGEDNVVRPSKF